MSFKSVATAENNQNTEGSKDDTRGANRRMHDFSFRVNET